jgi:hypothetical protein
VLVAALGIALNVYIFQNRKDRLDLQAARDREQNERIEALEKEVRILKTDLYVLQYGYEGEKND